MNEDHQIAELKWLLHKAQERERVMFEALNTAYQEAVYEDNEFITETIRTALRKLARPELDIRNCA